MSTLAAYRVATCVGKPLIRLYLAQRRVWGKEDSDRFGERLGFPGTERPFGPLIWMHGASVGEALSLLPLIDGILARWPEPAVLVTTGTVTSARLLARRLPPRAFHQFVPVDCLTYVRRFLDHWRPDLVIWAESEFWPNILSETARRDIPKVLIQGRISTRSCARWRRCPDLIRGLLRGFELSLGQTEIDTARLRELGAPRVKYVGNLKYAAAPLPVDAGELAAVGQIMAGRRGWLAASTHSGEELIAAQVHQRLQTWAPDILTIVVPRHPERGAAIAQELGAQGVAVARRSIGEAITVETDLYVADTIGELGLFYRLAPVAFIGKSLRSGGGQNPLEAAQLGCAILFGPQMDNFDAVARLLLEADAAVQVEDAADLAVAVARLLNDESARARQAAAAKAVAAEHASVVDTLVCAVQPFIERALGSGKAEAGHQADGSGTRASA